MLNKNSLGVKKCEKQGLAQVTKMSDIKEGQVDKLVKTTVEFVTWPLLQIMLDSTRRWPSDKANRSCENAL